MTSPLRSIAGRVMLIALLGLAACRRHHVSEQQSIHAHPSGLVLTVPVTFDDLATAVEPTASGFSIELSPERHRRWMRHVDVALRRSGPAPETDERRRVGERTIHHRTITGDCGNGGDEFRFTAWEVCGEGFVSYEQRDCSRFFGDDFTLAWTVIAGTDPRAACGAAAPAR